MTSNNYVSAMTQATQLKPGHCAGLFYCLLKEGHMADLFSGRRPPQSATIWILAQMSVRTQIRVFSVHLHCHQFALHAMRLITQR